MFNSAATALLACASAVPAETLEEVRSFPQWMVRAQERLGLAAGQQREIRALVDANASRLRELQARYADPARKGRREAMAALQREFRERLAAILTPGQLAEWDALVEELLGEVHLRNAPRLSRSMH
jgi:hypothetical protein